MSDPCGEPIIVDGMEFHCGNMATTLSDDGLVWRCWWCHRREQERSILTDLITELRETAAVKPGATGRLLMEMVGSAEARLREVGDE